MTSTPSVAAAAAKRLDELCCASYASTAISNEPQSSTPNSSSAKGTSLTTEPAMR